MSLEVAMYPAPAPRGLRVVMLLAMAGVAGWLMLSAYQAPATRECQRRYRDARTSAERAEVDGLVPDVLGNRGPEAHSCGFFRHAARWAP